MKKRFANPFVAASKGFIDEVIMPHSTRRRVAMGLRKLRNKEARESVEETRQHSALSFEQWLFAAIYHSGIARPRRQHRTPDPASGSMHSPASLRRWNKAGFASPRGSWHGLKARRPSGRPSGLVITMVVWAGTPAVVDLGPPYGVESEMSSYKANVRWTGR